MSMATEQKLGMKSRETVEHSKDASPSAADSVGASKHTFKPNGLSPEVFAKRLANFQTGEDAALCYDLSDQEWKGKKHHNLTTSQRSKVDVRLARSQTEQERQQQEAERLKLLELQQKDAEAALKLMEEEQRALAEERKRLAEEAEKQTLALLQAEEAERVRRAEEDARALREMLAAERESTEAKQRAHIEAMRAACAADQGQRVVPEEEFGFDAAERAQIEADARLARKLSERRPKRTSEDERIAQELQRLELRNYQQSKQRERSSAEASAAAPAPAPAPAPPASAVAAAAAAGGPAIVTSRLPNGVPYTAI